MRSTHFIIIVIVLVVSILTIVSTNVSATSLVEEKDQSSTTSRRLVRKMKPLSAASALWGDALADSTPTNPTTIHHPDRGFGLAFMYEVNRTRGKLLVGEDPTALEDGNEISQLYPKLTSSKRLSTTSSSSSSRMTHRREFDAMEVYDCNNITTFPLDWTKWTIENYCNVTRIAQTPFETFNVVNRTLLLTHALQRFVSLSKDLEGNTSSPSYINTRQKRGRVRGVVPMEITTNPRRLRVKSYVIPSHAWLTCASINQLVYIFDYEGVANRYQRQLCQSDDLYTAAVRKQATEQLILPLQQWLSRNLLRKETEPYVPMFVNKSLGRCKSLMTFIPREHEDEDLFSFSNSQNVPDVKNLVQSPFARATFSGKGIRGPSDGQSDFDLAYQYNALNPNNPVQDSDDLEGSNTGNRHVVLPLSPPYRGRDYSDSPSDLILYFTFMYAAYPTASVCQRHPYSNRPTAMNVNIPPWIVVANFADPNTEYGRLSTIENRRGFVLRALLAALSFNRALFESDPASTPQALPGVNFSSFPPLDILREPTESFPFMSQSVLEQTCPKCPKVPKTNDTAIIASEQGFISPNAVEEISGNFTLGHFPFQEPSSVFIDGWTAEGKDSAVLTHPTIRSYLQKHFLCEPSIAEGGNISNMVAKSGFAFGANLYAIRSLNMIGFSNRYIGLELMAISWFSLQVSEVTYRVLESSGWFDVDYGSSSIMDYNPHGQGAGCSFQQKKCNEADFLMPPIVSTPSWAPVEFKKPIPPPTTTTTTTTTTPSTTPTTAPTTTTTAAPAQWTYDAFNLELHFPNVSVLSDGMGATGEEKIWDLVKGSKYSNASVLQNQFCFTPGERACSINRKFTAECQVDTFPYDLPTNMRYFDNPRQGGRFENYNYCPVYYNGAFFCSSNIQGTTDHGDDHYCFDGVQSYNLTVTVGGDPIYSITTNASSSIPPTYIVNMTMYKKKGLTGCFRVVECDPYSFDYHVVSNGRVAGSGAKDGDNTTLFDNYVSVAHCHDVSKSNNVYEQPSYFMYEGEEYACPSFESVCSSTFQESPHLLPPTNAPDETPPTPTDPDDILMASFILQNSFGTNFDTLEFTFLPFPDSIYGNSNNNTNNASKLSMDDIVNQRSVYNPKLGRNVTALTAWLIDGNYTLLRTNTTTTGGIKLGGLRYQISMQTMRDATVRYGALLVLRMPPRSPLRCAGNLPSFTDFSLPTDFYGGDDYSSNATAPSSSNTSTPSFNVSMPQMFSIQNSSIEGDGNVRDEIIAMFIPHPVHLHTTTVTSPEFLCDWEPQEQNDLNEGSESSGGGVSYVDQEVLFDGDPGTFAQISLHSVFSSYNTFNLSSGAYDDSLSNSTMLTMKDVLANIYSSSSFSSSADRFPPFSQISTDIGNTTLSAKYTNTLIQDPIQNFPASYDESLPDGYDTQYSSSHLFLVDEVASVRDVNFQFDDVVPLLPLLTHYAHAFSSSTTTTSTSAMQAKDEPHPFHIRFCLREYIVPPTSSLYPNNSIPDLNAYLCCSNGAFVGSGGTRTTACPKGASSFPSNIAIGSVADIVAAMIPFFQDPSSAAGASVAVLPSIDFTNISATTKQQKLESAAMSGSQIPTGSIAMNLLPVSDPSAYTTNISFLMQVFAATTAMNATRFDPLASRFSTSKTEKQLQPSRPVMFNSGVLSMYVDPYVLSTSTEFRKNVESEMPSSSITGASLNTDGRMAATYVPSFMGSLNDVSIGISDAMNTLLRTYYPASMFAKENPAIDRNRAQARQMVPSSYVFTKQAVGFKCSNLSSSSNSAVVEDVPNIAVELSFFGNFLADGSNVTWSRFSTVADEKTAAMTRIQGPLVHFRLLGLESHGVTACSGFQVQVDGFELRQVTPSNSKLSTSAGTAYATSTPIIPPLSVVGALSMEHRAATPGATTLAELFGGCGTSSTPKDGAGGAYSWWCLYNTDYDQNSDTNITTRGVQNIASPLPLIIVRGRQQSAVWRYTKSSATSAVKSELVINATCDIPSSLLPTSGRFYAPPVPASSPSGTASTSFTTNPVQLFPALFTNTLPLQLKMFAGNADCPSCDTDKYLQLPMPFSTSTRAVLNSGSQKYPISWIFDGSIELGTTSNNMSAIPAGPASYSQFLPRSCGGGSGVVIPTNNWSDVSCVVSTSLFSITANTAWSNWVASPSYKYVPSSGFMLGSSGVYVGVRKGDRITIQFNGFLWREANMGHHSGKGIPTIFLGGCGRDGNITVHGTWEEQRLQLIIAEVNLPTNKWSGGSGVDPEDLLPNSYNGHGGGSTGATTDGAAFGGEASYTQLNDMLMFDANSNPVCRPLKGLLGFYMKGFRDPGVDYYQFDVTYEGQVYANVFETVANTSSANNATITRLSSKLIRTTVSYFSNPLGTLDGIQQKMYYGPFSAQCNYRGFMQYYKCQCMADFGGSDCTLCAYIAMNSTSASSYNSATGVGVGAGMMKIMKDVWSVRSAVAGPPGTGYCKSACDSVSNRGRFPWAQKCIDLGGAMDPQRGCQCYCNGTACLTPTRTVSSTISISDTISERETISQRVTISKTLPPTRTMPMTKTHNPLDPTTTTTTTTTLATTTSPGGSSSTVSPTGSGTGSSTATPTGTGTASPSGSGTGTVSPSGSDTTSYVPTTSGPPQTTVTTSTTKAGTATTSPTTTLSTTTPTTTNPTIPGSDYIPFPDLIIGTLLQLQNTSMYTPKMVSREIFSSAVISALQALTAKTASGVVSDYDKVALSGVKQDVVMTVDTDAIKSVITAQFKKYLGFGPVGGASDVRKSWMLSSFATYSTIELVGYCWPFHSTFISDLQSNPYISNKYTSCLERYTTALSRSDHGPFVIADSSTFPTTTSALSSDPISKPTVSVYFTLRALVLPVGYSVPLAISELRTAFDDFATQGGEYATAFANLGLVPNIANVAAAPLSSSTTTYPYPAQGVQQGIVLASTSGIANVVNFSTTNTSILSLETWPMWRTTQTMTMSKSSLPFVGKYPNIPTALTLHLPVVPSGEQQQQLQSQTSSSSSSVSSQRRDSYAPPASSIVQTKREILLSDIEGGLVFSLRLSSTNVQNMQGDANKALTFDRALCDLAASSSPGSGSSPTTTTTLPDLFNRLFELSSSPARTNNVTCTEDYSSVLITLLPLSLRTGVASATNFAFLRLFPLEKCPTPDNAESIPSSELPLYSRCRSDYIWRQVVEDVPVKVGLRRIIMLPASREKSSASGSPPHLITAYDAKIYAGGIHSSTPNLPLVLRNAIGFAVRLTFGGDDGPGDASDITSSSSAIVQMEESDFYLVKRDTFKSARNFLMVSNYIAGILSLLFLPWSFFMELQLLPIASQLFPRANDYCSTVKEWHLTDIGEQNAIYYVQPDGREVAAITTEPYLFTEDRGITEVQSQAMGLHSPYLSWAFLLDILFFFQITVEKEAKYTGRYEYDYIFISVVTFAVFVGVAVMGLFMIMCLCSNAENRGTEERRGRRARNADDDVRSIPDRLEDVGRMAPLTAMAIVVSCYYIFTGVVSFGQSISYNKPETSSYSLFPWPEQNYFSTMENKTPNVGLEAAIMVFAAMIPITIVVSWMYFRTAAIIAVPYIPYSHLPRVLAAQSPGCWRRSRPDDALEGASADGAGGSEESRSRTQYMRSHRLYTMLFDMLILSGITSSSSSGADLDDVESGSRRSKKSKKRGGSRRSRRGADEFEEDDVGGICKSLCTFATTNPVQFTQRLYSKVYLSLTHPSWISEGQWKLPEGGLVGRFDGAYRIYFLLRHLKGSVVEQGLFTNNRNYTTTAPRRQADDGSKYASDREGADDGDVNFDTIDDLSVSLADNASEAGSRTGSPKSGGGRRSTSLSPTRASGRRTPQSESTGRSDSRYSPRERQSIADREVRSSEDRASSAVGRGGGPGGSPTNISSPRSHHLHHHSANINSDMPIVIGSGEVSDNQAFRLTADRNAAANVAKDRERKHAERTQREKGNRKERDRRLRKNRQQADVGVWVMCSPLLVYIVPFLRNFTIALLVGLAGRYDVCNDEKDVFDSDPYFNPQSAAFSILGLLLASSIFFAFSRPYLITWQNLLHVITPIFVAITFIFSFVADSNITHQDDLLVLSSTSSSFNQSNDAYLVYTYGVVSAVFAVMYGVLVLWVGVGTFMWIFHSVEKSLLPDIEELLGTLDVDTTGRIGAEMVLVNAIANRSSQQLQQQQQDAYAESAAASKTSNRLDNPIKTPPHVANSLPATRPPRSPVPLPVPTQPHKKLAKISSVDSLDLGNESVEVGYKPPTLPKPNATKPTPVVGSDIEDLHVVDEDTPLAAASTTTAAQLQSKPHHDEDIEPLDFAAFDEDLGISTATAPQDQTAQSSSSPHAVPIPPLQQPTHPHDSTPAADAAASGSSSGAAVPPSLPQEGTDRAPTITTIISNSHALNEEDVGRDDDIGGREGHDSMKDDQPPMASSSTPSGGRDYDMDLELELDEAEGYSPPPTLHPKADTPAPPSTTNNTASSPPPPTSGAVQVDEEFFFMDDWNR